MILLVVASHLFAADMNLSGLFVRRHGLRYNGLHAGANYDDTTRGVGPDQEIAEGEG